MRNKILVAAFFAGTSVLSLAQESAALVQLEVKDVPVENGKKLEMSFQEIEREADYSIVDVSFVSGGSVSSSMFIMRGMCKVMRARGEKYFQVEEISKPGKRYRVRFPRSMNSTENPLVNASTKAMSIDACTLMKF